MSSCVTSYKYYDCIIFENKDHVICKKNICAAASHEYEEKLCLACDGSLFLFFFCYQFSEINFYNCLDD